MQNFEHLQRAAADPLRWTLHPAVPILLWMAMTVAIQSVSPGRLLALGALLVAIAIRLSAARLWLLLRRVRWVMLTLLLVYGYVTPGDPVAAALGAASPTTQGLADGVLQLCRLTFALAGLSIVLGILPRAKLVAGLYTLAYPLRALGVSRERFAVRLALTLHYAESAMADARQDWRSSLERALDAGEGAHGEIELHRQRFAWQDGLVFAAACGLLALVWQ